MAEQQWENSLWDSEKLVQLKALFCSNRHTLASDWQVVIILLKFQGIFSCMEPRCSPFLSRECMR